MRAALCRSLETPYWPSQKTGTCTCPCSSPTREPARTRLLAALHAAAVTHKQLPRPPARLIELIGQVPTGHSVGQ